MAKVFRVYASLGRYNYAELDLPASGYKMLDLMERLRLKPGQLPYVEVLKIREEYDYLAKCITELPDIYQLNALAQKLSEFTSVLDMAAFEGMVGVEMRKTAVPIEITKLIDFAHSTKYCHVAEDAVTDYQLGKFLVENDFIADAIDLPDSALALLDYGKIGKEHREAEGGVYTSFGYVEVYEDVRRVSEAMDFQPRKSAYTVLLNVTATPLCGPIRQENMIRLRLPAPEEQMREALQKLGAKDWRDTAVSILDCPIPSLNHEIYVNGEAPQILALSQCLSELDARDEMPKYKALLAAMDCSEIGQAITLAGTLDEYIFDPKTSSPEDVAMGELGVMVGSEYAASFAQYVNLTAFGRSLLERDHAVLTGYGLIERQDCQPVQSITESPEQGGMEMV